MRQPRLDLIPASRLLIGEDEIHDPSGGTAEHFYAATGQMTASVALAGEKEVDAAVRLARTALPAWAASPLERRAVILRMAQILRDNAADLAQLSIIDSATPVAIAHLEYIQAAEYLEYNAGWADKLEGHVVPSLRTTSLDYAPLEPYGVVGVIVPWNGPVAVLGIVGGPALAAGNTIVVKSPEVTPFASLRVAELFREAGLPPGVVTMIAGGPAGGQALVRHPGVDKVHFTGSPLTARDVLAKAAENITPCALELGGKSANIVFADADLDRAVPLALAQITAKSGQGCIRGTRLLVERSVYDEVIDRCRTAAEQVKVGDPLDPETQMGPVISAGAHERILGTIQRAVDEGAGRLVCGGQRGEGDLADGYFLTPAILADVDPASDVAQHEIFGPVLAVMPFADDEEAVQLANSTQYALAGYIQTADVRRAHAVAARMVTGNVWINGFGGMLETAPFGGSKISGFGRVGGSYGIREFVRPKNVWVGLS